MRASTAMLLGPALAAVIVGDAAAQNCFSPPRGTSCSVCPVECVEMDIIGQKKDIEIIVDPADTTRMLLVTNDGDVGTENGPLGDILIYKLSSTSGEEEEAVPAPEPPVADNYSGRSDFNGPEFFVPADSTGELHIVYRAVGPEGIHVHSSTRPGAEPWYAFEEGTRLPANLGTW